jgi:hypothetical protein
MRSQLLVYFTFCIFHQRKEKNNCAYDNILPSLKNLRMLVACVYNPSYLRGRDQVDCGSKPARQIVHETLFQKYPMQKMTGGVAQIHEDLNSNPRTTEKEKRIEF